DLNHQDLGAHFARSRQEFYSAESLREFSRDSVPTGTFESLLHASNLVAETGANKLDLKPASEIGANV
ncbi:MAG: ABC-three component system protein, partial [Acidobacteriota bacterium]